MGTSANNQCKDGESYIFRDDGIVERKRCVDGRIVKDTLAWKVEHRGDDNVLSIGTSEYQARVRIDKDSEIHLRTLVFDKAKPSQEIILKYEKD